MTAKQKAICAWWDRVERRVLKEGFTSLPLTREGELDAILWFDILLFKRTGADCHTMPDMGFGPDGIPAWPHAMETGQ